MKVGRIGATIHGEPRAGVAADLPGDRAAARGGPRRGARSEALGADNRPGRRIEASPPSRGAPAPSRVCRLTGQTSSRNADGQVALRHGLRGRSASGTTSRT
jgi:hypothetical protein